MSGFFAVLLIGASAQELLSQANTAAAEGELDRAIEQYEALLAQDPGASGAWLNLGNAAFRAGRLGQAIAAFRTAHAMAPRDARIASNLERARKEAEDRLAPPEPSPAVRALFFWHHGASRAELGWALIATNPVVWGLIFLLRRRPRLARIVGIVGLTLISALLGSWTLRQWAPERIAVIRDDDTQVRTRTDRRADVRFVLNAGAELRWRERAAGWIRVALPSGQQGWVHEEGVFTLEL